MEDNQQEKKKGFWAKLMDKLDKKLSKVSKSGCCCSDKESDESTCSNN